MTRRFPWRSQLATALAVAVVAGCGVANPLRAGLDPTELSKARAQVAANASGTANVVIHYQTAANLTELVNAGFDVWGVEGGKAKGTATAETLKAVERLNLKTETFVRMMNTFDKGYKSVEQIEAELKGLAAKYPQLAKVEDFGDSWEKKQGKGGHDLYVLKIGTGDTAKKPGVIYLGNHHAREIVTPEIVLNLAHLLLDNYGKDPEVTAMVDSRDIWLVPTVNPDGHKVAEKGVDWRKNTDTSLVAGPISFGPNGPGIDLNRNYGFKWGGEGASADPRNATFRGPGAFSEPETQAVRDLVQSRKFTFLMTYHSFSNLVLWPWGYTDAAPSDKRLPAIGQKLGSFNGYTAEQSKDLYKTSGDTTDWAFGELGILAYTTEIGSWNDNFDPPYSRMEKFWNENKPGALYLLKLADNPGAVFGPELTNVSVAGGRIQVQSKQPISRVEAYVGTPGTGMQAGGTGTTASLAMPTSLTERRQVLMVRAQGANGQWGPAQAVWSR
ncbi:MAG TPA: M14 family metallopeptidase [Stenomitos sp.]